MKPLLIFIFVMTFISFTLQASEPRILEWDEMMPEGYVESLLNRDNSTFSATDTFSFDDSTEQAQKAYDELRAKLESSPIVPELNNQLVKLAGFIVPLNFDFDTETFDSFLLVPYFGACIHTPPPPSNQIVHVSLNKALDQEYLNFAVWVSGLLKTQSKDSELAYAAYSMTDVSVEEYKEE